MNSAEFGAVLTVLEAGFGLALDVRAREVWYAQLRSLSGEAVLWAAKELCTTWPKDRRPWLTDVYQTAQQFVRPIRTVADIPTPPALASGKDPREEIKKTAREVLHRYGDASIPGPQAVAIPVVVEIIAEKYRDAHPRATVADTYSEVMRAIIGKGDFAALWLTLRDRLPQTLDEEPF